jgi:Zn-dependent M28 family amino/carboxypeptidase
MIGSKTIGWLERFLNGHWPEPRGPVRNWQKEFYMTKATRSAPALGLALTAFAATMVFAADLGADGDRWWRDIAALAADDMEGRFTGSPGYMRAAQYVADRFKAQGLEPAGSDGWFQPVELLTQTIDFDQSQAVLIDGSNRRILSASDDILFSSRLPQPEMVEAELVFIGYGLSLPEVGYDDYGAQDLKGKILVQIAGGPGEIAGALKSHSRANETNKALARVGALGLISIANPKSMDIPWARQIGLARSTGMYLADAKLRDAPAIFFAAAFNPAKADILFAKSGHSLAELLALADQDKPLPHFALNQKLSAKVQRVQGSALSPNVVGRLVGSDPKLKSEYVVLSAHLDHLGMGPAVNGKRIFRGAMDNASGIASLIEAARVLTKEGARPKRSVIFLALTGEERGLLGSRAYAAAPTGLGPGNDPDGGLGKLVANVNMDMFLPLWPLKSLVVLGANESSIGPIAQAAASRAGISLVPDPEPNRNLFVRSDQYNFIRTGVPAISPKFAATNEQELAIQKAFLRDRYHARDDDLDQPVDREAAAQFNLWLADVIHTLADAPARPSWNETSFFKRYGTAK